MKLDDAMKPFYAIFLLLCASCGFVHVGVNDTNRLQQVELGGIGVDQMNEVYREFHLFAVPDVQERIRVHIQEIPMTDKQIKGLYKEKSHDTLASSKDESAEQGYIAFSLQVIDKVSLLQELQSEKNQAMTQLIRHDDQLKIVNSLSLVDRGENAQLLRNAWEAYLIKKGIHKNQLELIDQDNKRHQIDLSSKQVIDFDTWGFCWGENDRHEFVIKDLTRSGCTKPLYKSYRKAKKKSDELKF